MFVRKAHTGRKVAIGSLIAGVTGYLAGILTAPNSGQETRDDIAYKAEDIKYDASQRLHTAQEELGQTIKKAEAKTVSLGAQARGEFNEALVRAKDAQNKAKTVLKAVKDGQSDDPELAKAVKQAKQAKKNLSKFLKA